jgi:hypothetical protein
MPTEEEGRGGIGRWSLAGLETAARDAMQKLMNNPDVQNVAEIIMAGPLKVGVFYCCCFFSLSGHRALLYGFSSSLPLHPIPLFSSSALNPGTVTDFILSSSPPITLPKMAER